METQTGIATKEDIERLKKQIDACATKDDLKRFATKDDIEDLREEIKDNLTDFKSEILNSVDTVMGELKSMREESDVHDFSHSRIDDTLLEHDDTSFALSVIARESGSAGRPRRSLLISIRDCFVVRLSLTPRNDTMPMLNAKFVDGRISKLEKPVNSV